MFALRHKKTQELLRFYIKSNVGMVCTETRRVFGLHDGNVYLTTFMAEADYVRRHGDHWYDGFEHEFTEDELEIVEVQLNVVSLEKVKV